MYHVLKISPGNSFNAQESEAKKQLREERRQNRLAEQEKQRQERLEKIMSSRLKRQVVTHEDTETFHQP
eukprot:309868-Amorphochlora_amoeboformis.AAC.1